MKEPAAGVMATIVNGEVLLENGEHTGALPGKVARNTYLQSERLRRAWASSLTARCPAR